MKRSEDSVSRLVRMLEDTVLSLRPIVFLYDSRLSAVNLIFDWVIVCKNSTQIKSSASESVLLIWQLYCLPVLISTTVASFLISVDIKSSTVMTLNHFCDVLCSVSLYNSVFAWFICWVQTALTILNNKVVWCQLYKSMCLTAVQHHLTHESFKICMIRPDFYLGNAL